MDNSILTKKYPAATEFVAKMLGIHQSDTPEVPQAAPLAHALPVANLPVAPLRDPSFAETIIPVVGEPEVPLKPEAHGPAYLKVAKAAAPYIAVFLVGLFLYYFFFTGANFSGLFNSQPKATATPKESALQQLEKQNLSAYQTWISGFYYDISDAKVIDPNYDNSGNGLSNFQKYLLNLNPKSYDTLGLGMSDSQAIAQGINPLTGGGLTDSQKDIIAKYIDMEVVMNRLSLYNLQNPSRVAGASINTNSVQPSNPIVQPSQGLNIRGEDFSQTETQLGTNPVLVNTSIAGRLEIPDLKIDVPIIWSQDPKDFEKDLQSGVVHYPGTAFPGDIGTTYIAGHSSNYVWAKGNYNQIFTKLGNLGLNTSFKITLTQTNGKPAVFNYVVSQIKQFSPTDQAQFQNTGKSLVALSTCWPVGSTAKRLVVFGELTQTQR